MKLLPHDFFEQVKQETKRYARQTIDEANRRLEPHSVLSMRMPVTLGEP